VERAVRAHGHRRTEGIGAFGSAGGESEDILDFEGTFALAETNSFFDGEFVEWVEGVLDAGCFDAGLGFVDTGFDLVSLISARHARFRPMLNQFGSSEPRHGGNDSIGPSLVVVGRAECDFFTKDGGSTKTHRVVDHPLDGD
jgi:hypothetical protein